MATGHQLATITNSCVKSPLNPHNGLVSTLNERSNLSYRTAWDEKDKDRNDNHEKQRHAENSGHLFFNKTGSTVQDITADLKDLTDDEFYQKLIQLKEDHKKTLQICEQLYTEKVGKDYLSRSPTRDILRDDYVLDDQQPVHDHDTFNASREILKKECNAICTSVDSVKDMTPPRKPPTGKPQASRGRPATSSRHAWTSHSDKDYWKATSARSTDVDTDREDCRQSRKGKHIEDDLNASRSSAISHIEDMWDNFSIEDYAPRPRKPRSSSLSRLSTTPKKDSAAEWRHRVTVPKPFNLTEQKNQTDSENKSRTLKEFELERMEKEQMEEYECQKQFKATPIPAHVYMPLYNEIVEKQESQRLKTKETSEMLLKSQEKPFKFMKREMEKKKYHPDVPNTFCEEEKTMKKKEFKARPFPAEIFDNSVDDQMMEEEEYRRIRIQMRSEDLLRAASLPPNMEARGEEYVLGKSRVKGHAEKAKKSGLISDGKFKPRINNTVPDFDELHRKFQSDLNYKKNAKEATVCKPFNLRTTRTVKKGHTYADFDDQSRMRGKRCSFKKPKKEFIGSLPRSMTSSMDSLPTKMTASSQLRASVTKSKLQKQIENELSELDARRKRRQRERELQHHVWERAMASDGSHDLRRSMKNKLQEYREAERARRKEYRQELDEIEERVGQRPLLFERTAQNNAQRAAERRYLDTLKRAGIDEEFVNRKGSRAGSARHDADDTGSDKEDSYNYPSYDTDTRSPTRSRSAMGRRSPAGSGIKTDEDISEVDED